MQLKKIRKILSRFLTLYPDLVIINRFSVD